ncbi:MAG: glutamine--fructose-6-phosphate transaminase (isomerizing) [Thermoplasmata archaeon]
MCGIVGYTGFRKAAPLLLESLKRLEYRGYDSAGVAIVEKRLRIYKDKGEIDKLRETMPNIPGTSGIAHTRWATHGQPTKANAHPFADCRGEIAVIHNGIIENYMDLKQSLLKRGHKFKSETDTETFVHLLEENYDGSLESTFRKVLPSLDGSFAFAAVHLKERGKIVVARKESPLVVGMGEGENFAASDVPALLKETDRVISLHDNEMAVLTPDSIEITTFDGKKVTRQPKRIRWTIEDAKRGGYEHFMLKEIFEQPQAVHSTLLGRIADFDVNRFGRGAFSSVKTVACGTSYHAALAGKYILEDIAKVPTEAQLASEYRYSTAAFGEPLVVLITQSGETADTLGAAREARKRGRRTLAITNYVGSSITREVGDVMYTRAGLEIGVAASKTFLTQLIALYILSIQLGLARRTLSLDESRKMKEELRLMPRVVQGVLDEHKQIEKIAKKYHNVRDIFFLGRNVNYPTALEGALKMKEISYIHAEGYPAGELKHGPLALIGKETPIVAIAVKDHTYGKMLGNIKEVSARNSPVVAIASESDRDIEKYVDHVLHIPDVPPIFTPIPATVVLQLLAYYAARERGCSIDKPRHLAKSVTVE